MSVHEGPVLRLERIECDRPKCLEQWEQCEAVRAWVYASIPAACFAVGATLGHSGRIVLSPFRMLCS